jgi:O-antigen/teichoic acid export membrane protein
MSQLSRGELREAALAGVRWMTIARVASELVLLGSTVVLARLITPAEFGLAAIALIVTALATVLTGESFGTPLVQRKEAGERHIRAAVAMSLAFGALLTAVTFLLAPLSAPLFGDETPDLIQLMAPAFVISSVSVVPHAMLQRRLDFRRLSSIEIVHRIAGSVISVGLAVGGLNAEAILLGSLAGAALSSILLVRAAHPPRPGFDREAMRDIATFGIPAALSGLLRSVNRNVDYAIIGARLGAAQVGLYWRAFQFGVEYQSKISSIMMRVALPVYSRAASLDDMRALRARIVRVHATILFPLLALLIVLAPEGLPWLLGEPWRPAVLPTQILAVAGMTAAVMTGLGPLMLAMGKPKALLYWNLCAATAYGVMVYLVAPLGLTQICVAVVAMRLVTLLIAQRVLIQGVAGIPMRTLLDDAGPAVVASLALLGVGFPATAALVAAGVPTLATCVVVAAVGGAAYALTLRLLFESTWADVMLLASRVLPPLPRRKIGAVQPVALSE